MKQKFLESSRNYLNSIINRYFIRSVDFGENFEAFFVSAILAILGLRIWLKFVNYIIVGSGNIHIAHMLWGGALMALAMTIVITFLGKSSKKLAAVLGGLGFGTFIDELGKFITADNNYFYQPTFSIIYIIFVILYLISRSIKKNQNFSKREYLANSVEYLEEAITSDLDAEEKEAAIKLLLKADQDNPITKALIQLCRDLETIPQERPNILTKIRSGFSKLYFSLVSKAWFPKLINGLFILQFLVSSIVIIISMVTLIVIIVPGGVTYEEIRKNLSEILNLFANGIAGIFVIWGVLLMRHSRLMAFQKFKESILISIFLVQVFTFYNEQLTAFAGLITNILILTALNYMIVQEENVLKRN